MLLCHITMRQRATSVPLVAAKHAFSCLGTAAPPEHYIDMTASVELFAELSGRSITGTGIPACCSVR